MKKENGQLVQLEMLKRPIYIGGIRQNCYALDVRPGTDVLKIHSPNRTIKKYYALEKKDLENGFTEEVIEKDYPINSESVSSYIESSDYRNDPMQAMANAPKRVNLGDISDVQKFMKENPVEATKQYADILTKVADYMKSQAKQPAPTPTPTPKPTEDK